MPSGIVRGLGLLDDPEHLRARELAAVVWGEHAGDSGTGRAREPLTSPGGQHRFRDEASGRGWDGSTKVQGGRDRTTPADTMLLATAATAPMATPLSPSPTPCSLPTPCDPAPSPPL